MCWVFLLHLEQDFCNFCCKPSKIKFCIEGVSVGEICNTLLDSNEGDLSPHTSQTMYFSKTNENKRSDKEAPMGEVVELELGIEPLSSPCLENGTTWFACRAWSLPENHLQKIWTKPANLCQKHVSGTGISKYVPRFLWGVFTPPCLWYLHLALSIYPVNACTVSLCLGMFHRGKLCDSIARLGKLIHLCWR